MRWRRLTALPSQCASASLIDAGRVSSTYVAMSPDGKFMASCANDKTVITYKEDNWARRAPFCASVCVCVRVNEQVGLLSSYGSQLTTSSKGEGRLYRSIGAVSVCCKGAHAAYLCAGLEYCCCDGSCALDPLWAPLLMAFCSALLFLCYPPSLTACDSDQMCVCVCPEMHGRACKGVVVIMGHGFAHGLPM
eukprot:1160203-Pelagomonas_calceolata.AAC.2